MKTISQKITLATFEVLLHAKPEKENLSGIFEIRRIFCDETAILCMEIRH